MKKPILERFFKHIKVTDSGCWIWKNPQDTGRCQFYDGTQQLRAHTWVYRFFKRHSLPTGIILVASCGDPLCVAPWHIKPQNALLRFYQEHVAMQRAKTQCLKGHPYDAENTYWYRNAQGNMARNCRACMHQRDMAKSKAFGGKNDHK